MTPEKVLQEYYTKDLPSAISFRGSLREQLAKYERNTTYLSRFCCAPGEPFYAMGPANYLTSTIKALTAIIAADDFENEKQKQLTFSLLEEYQEFNRLYIKSAHLDLQQ